MLSFPFLCLFLSFFPSFLSLLLSFLSFLLVFLPSVLLSFSFSLFLSVLLCLFLSVLLSTFLCSFSFSFFPCRFLSFCIGFFHGWSSDGVPDGRVPCANVDGSRFNSPLRSAMHDDSTMRCRTCMEERRGAVKKTCTSTLAVVQDMHYALIASQLFDFGQYDCIDVLDRD